MTHVVDEMAAQKSTIPCSGSRMSADLELYTVENRYIYPLRRRQTNLLVSTLAFQRPSLMSK